VESVRETKLLVVNTKEMLIDYGERLEILDLFQGLTGGGGRETQNVEAVFRHSWG
jgi:hypothetical protein